MLKEVMKIINVNQSENVTIYQDESTKYFVVQRGNEQITQHSKDEFMLKSIDILLNIKNGAVVYVDVNNGIEANFKNNISQLVLKGKYEAAEKALRLMQKFDKYKRYVEDVKEAPKKTRKKGKFILADLGGIENLVVYAEEEKDNVLEFNNYVAPTVIAEFETMEEACQALNKRRKEVEERHNAQIDKYVRGHLYDRPKCK